MTTGGIIVYISITPQRKAQDVKERQCFPRGDEALREVFFEKKAAGVLTPGVRSIRLDTLTPVGSAGRHRIFERDREGKEGRRRETCGNDSE